MRQLFCTFLYRMERGVDDKNPLGADVIPWIARWAAICYSRFHVEQDGKTAWERLRRRSCNVPVVPIGETVWYKEWGDGGDRTNTAETEWFRGVWLGPNLRSTETLVGTTKGVVRAYAMLSPSTQWDINQILDMKGTTQRPDPSTPGLSIPVKIRLEPDVKVDMPISRPARKKEGPRDVYLSRGDFETYRYTEGCEGCSRLTAGMAPRPHTAKCRLRMKDDMEITPEGRKRLEEADRKIHEYLESKLVETHGAKDESERPGIIGSRMPSKPSVCTKVVHASDPYTLPGVRVDKPESSPPRVSSSTQGPQTRKIAVEDEGDDAGRGDIFLQP